MDIKVFILQSETKSDYFNGCLCPSHFNESLCSGYKGSICELGIPNIDWSQIGVLTDLLIWYLTVFLGVTQGGKIKVVRCTCVYYSNAGTNGKRKTFFFERFGFQTQKRCRIYFPVQLGTESEWLFVRSNGFPPFKGHGWTSWKVALLPISPLLVSFIAPEMVSS